MTDPTSVFAVQAGDAVFVTAESLRDRATAILRAAGLSTGDAVLVASGLVEADLRGVDSHGVSNMLEKYVEWLASGHANPSPVVKVLRERPSTATIDADRGLGLVVGPHAMDLAIAKAGDTGVGMVSVGNGRHLGMAAFTAMRALRYGMIGVCTTAVGPMMYPTFGREPRLGSNPLAVAVPAGSEPAFVYDASWTVVANNKIRLAQRLGSTLPGGLVVDAEGQPILEPVVADSQHDGALLPLGSTAATGSHKGYGMACVSEILSSLLSGSMFLARVGRGHANHFVAALDVEAFLPREDFLASMDDFLLELKHTPPVSGQDRVLVAGQLEWEAAERRALEGVPLHPEVVAGLDALCSELGVSSTLRMVDGREY